MNLNLTDKELSLVLTALSKIWWEEEGHLPKDQTSKATAKRVERKVQRAQDHPETLFE
tara:strand:- start:643 stop:816 length:174 start_codon:yes stop_codon:yes gene_type:complete